MPAGQNAVKGKQGFQRTEHDEVDLGMALSGPVNEYAIQPDFYEEADIGSIEGDSAEHAALRGTTLADQAAHEATLPPREPRQQSPGRSAVDSATHYIRGSLDPEYAAAVGSGEVVGQTMRVRGAPDENGDVHVRVFGGHDEVEFGNPGPATGFPAGPPARAAVAAAPEAPKRRRLFGRG